jgi:hypothetical protein
LTTMLLVVCGGVAACSDSQPVPGPAADAAVDATQLDARADAAALGPRAAYCAAYPTFRKACGKGLLCENRFAEWCPSYAATSSEVAAAAYAACAEPARCADKELKDCTYLRYTGPRTAAQNALLDAVCTQCEPADVARCKAKNVAYDRGLGPDSITDLYLAVWESSDGVATQMKDACTGSALAADAGADAQADSGRDAGTLQGTACFTAFSRCAAGIYIDAIPACLK